MKKSRKYISFDIFTYFDKLKETKKILTIVLLSFAVLGIIQAFSIPRIYKASVRLAPESSSGSSLSSSLSSMASLVGLSKNFMGGNDAIFPEIYPDIMESTDFLVSLFPVQVVNKNGSLKCDYYTYKNEHQKSSLLDYPKLALAKTMEFLFVPSDDGVVQKGKQQGPNPFHLSKKEFEIADGIRKSIDCTVDKKTSIITITVTDQDPVIAAALADTIKNRLQVFITDYRTKKAVRDYEYMKKLCGEAKADYEAARRKYAGVADANQDVILQSVQSKLEDLENDMQLKYNIYTQVAEQLQMSQAKVQERTPVYTVVQNATVPMKHSNKPKVLILAAFLLVGFFFYNMFIFYRYWKDILIHEREESVALTMSEEE